LSGLNFSHADAAAMPGQTPAAEVKNRLRDVAETLDIMGSLL